MDLACYPKRVVEIYDELMGRTTSQASLEVPITTIDCEHCGKPFKVGDSITVDDKGTIKSCQHWNL